MGCGSQHVKNDRPGINLFGGGILCAHMEPQRPHQEAGPHVEQRHEDHIRHAEKHQIGMATNPHQHRPPPQLRREDISGRYFLKLTTDPTFRHTHNFLENPPRRRLKSRHPPWERSSALLNQPSVAERWKNTWNTAVIPNGHLITDPTVQVQGFNLPRKQWCTINRIRTGQGRCADSMHRWGLQSSPFCDCDRRTPQTIQHIVEECPNRRFPGGIQDLHQLGESARRWIEDLDVGL